MEWLLVAAHHADDKMQAELGAVRGGQLLCQGITVRVRPHVVVDALHKGHVVAALGEFGFHDPDVAVTIESEKIDEPASEAACGAGGPPGRNLAQRR